VVIVGRVVVMVWVVVMILLPDFRIAYTSSLSLSSSVDSSPVGGR
jgi:hypothetical protein